MTLVKVTRIPLICNVRDRDGKEVNYKDVFTLLWELQKETRRIKNKAIQLLWEWNGFSSDYKKKFDEYPDCLEHLGYKQTSGYLYDRLKSENVMNSGNFTCTLDCARNQFESSLKEYMRGDRSIIEYKSNQPLELHNKSIRVSKTDKEYLFDISLFSREFAKSKNLPTTLSFRGVVKDKSARDILDRCIGGVYKIGGSRLVYDKKKNWCLNLAYNFEACKQTLDKDKILGIDLGVQKPFVASVLGDRGRLSAEGGRESEIEVFRRKIEARRKSLRKQSKMSADGRKGHGYKTRNLSANSLENKISQFRDTVNHKYSRAIVDYAIKNGCGTIQMEKLSGITQGEKPRYLKNWSYFDLQSKIENKAKENGIKVVYVEPRFTSQRCSKCGFIHEKNRPEQSKFICQSCGYEVNADFNASQNIATKNIEKLIKEAVK